MKKSKLNALNQDLNVLQSSFRRIVFLGRNYKQEKKKQDKLITKKENMVGSPEENLHTQVEIMRDWVLSKFYYFVIVVDLFLAYVVLQEYHNTVPFLPTWLKSIMLITCLVGIEYAIGLFKSSGSSQEIRSTQESGIESDTEVNQAQDSNVVSSSSPDDIFRFQEDEDEQELERLRARKKNRIALIASIVFISVLPIMSLSELFQELSNSALIEGFGENESFENSAAHQRTQAIFKFGGLAICSFLMHLFLILFGEQINLAKARNKTRKVWKEYDKQIDSMEDSLNTTENTIVSSVIDYHDRRKMHTLRFGPHSALPPATFPNEITAICQEAGIPSEETQDNPLSNRTIGYG